MQDSPHSRSSLRRSVGLFNLDAAKANPNEPPTHSLKRPRPLALLHEEAKDGSASWEASIDASEAWGYNSHNTSAGTTIEFSPGTSLSSSLSSTSSDQLRLKQQSDHDIHFSPPRHEMRPPTLHPRSFDEEDHGMHSPSGVAEQQFPRSLSSDAATSPRNDDKENLLARISGASSVGSLGSFRAARPLQTAFRSAGLQSKRNRMLQDSYTEMKRQVPETPCKKPPTFQSHKSLGEGTSWDNLFETHSSLSSSEQKTPDAGFFSQPSHADKSLKLAEGVIKRISLSKGDETPVKSNLFEGAFTSTPARANRNISEHTITPHGLNSSACSTPTLRLTEFGLGMNQTKLSGGLQSRFTQPQSQPQPQQPLQQQQQQQAQQAQQQDDTDSTPATPDCSSNSSRRSSRSLRTSLYVEPEPMSGDSDIEVPCTPGGVHGPSCAAIGRQSAGRLTKDFAHRNGSSLFALENSSDLLLRNQARSSKSMLFDAHLAAKFERVEVLGEGEFSNVYTVIVPSGHKCAVKRSKKPVNGAKARLRRLEEVTILKHLSNCAQTLENEGSDFVLDFQNAWEDSGHLYIMSEFCENGSLDRFLSELGNTSRLDEWRVWKILGEIACGLSFVHSSGILHLDLKPANIFITFEGSLKIGDFGMAAFYPVSEGLEREGDREYIAPEILSQQLYTPQADIFSFGIMMLEIAANIVLPDNGENWQKLRSGDLSDAGRLSSGDLSRAASAPGHGFTSVPVSGTSTSSLLNTTNRSSGHERHSYSSVPYPPSWAPKFMIDDSRALDDLVERMLSPDPNNRPSAAQITQLPEMIIVDERRQAGAIVFEGEYGPLCETVGPIWRAN